MSRQSNNVRLSVCLDEHAPGGEQSDYFVRLHDESSDGDGVCWLEMVDAIRLRDELSDAIERHEKRQAARRPS